MPGPWTNTRKNSVSGKWEYSEDSGATWLEFGSTADISVVSGGLSTLDGTVTTNAAASLDIGGYSYVNLEMPTQPTAADTITIGATDVYELDGGGVNINVALGIDVAATRAALVVAINTLGTENVLAGSPGGSVIYLRAADAPGGTPVVGVGPSLAVSVSMAAGGNVLRQTNFNESGRAPSKHLKTSIVCTAENVAGSFVIGTPEAVTSVTWSAYTATGELIEATTGTVIASAGNIVCNFSTGGSPLIATNVVKIFAW